MELPTAQNNPELIPHRPDKIHGRFSDEAGCLLPVEEEKIPLIDGPSAAGIDRTPATMVLSIRSALAEVLERTLYRERFRRAGAIGRRCANQALELEKCCADFHNGILPCSSPTDVAARGLQFMMSVRYSTSICRTIAEDYVHRIGPALPPPPPPAARRS